MTATRVTGVMALPGLAWIAWQATRGDSQRPPGSQLASPKHREGGERAKTGSPRRLRSRRVAPASDCTCVHNYSVSGSLFAWYDAITHWNYAPGHNPFTTVFAVLRALITRPANYLAEPMAPYDTLNTFAAIGALALVPYCVEALQFWLCLDSAGRDAAPALVRATRRTRPLRVGAVSHRHRTREHGWRSPTPRTAHRVRDALRGLLIALCHGSPAVLNKGHKIRKLREVHNVRCGSKGATAHVCTAALRTRTGPCAPMHRTCRISATLCTVQTCRTRRTRPIY